MSKLSIRTLIVDDEPLAREGIRLALAESSDFDIVGEATHGVEAVKLIKKYAPDLVFLDIQMPELDGFEVLRRLDARHMPLVVFVTAYDKFALAAFGAHALDYVLKPINPERFAQTLARVRNRFSERQIQATTKRLLELLGSDADALRASPSPLKRIAVRSGDKITLVEVAQIDWIEAQDYYVNIHCGKTTHLIRESLTHLEARLDSGQFLRIHRSTIVNVGRIRELVKHFRGEYFVVLHDGKKLKLSRTYHEAVARIMNRQ